MEQGDILDPGLTEPRRDRFGRYLIVPPGGGKPQSYQRATTFADLLDDRYHLELWKMRQVATGLAGRPDLIAQLATTETTDKKTINRVCQEAMDAVGSGAAATLGTALHKATELADLNQPVPAMFATQVARYTAALEAAQVEVLVDHVEQVVVHEPLQIAGTFDRVVRIGDQLYIADLKTGSSIEWSARGFSIQLGLYATATTWYDWRSETHQEPLPVSQERAVVIHLPASGDTCTLHWLDISAGIAAQEPAAWVRNWRKRKDLYHGTVEPGTPAGTPLEVQSHEANTTSPDVTGDPTESQEEPNRLAERVKTVLDQLPKTGSAASKDLASRWPHGTPGPARSDQWTWEHITKIEQTLELDLHLNPTVDLDLNPTLPQTDTNPTPTPVSPPPGGQADRDQCDLIIHKTAALDNTDTEILRGWITQATRRTVRWDHQTYRSNRRLQACTLALELIERLYEHDQQDNNQTPINLCLRLAREGTDPHADQWPIGVQLGTMTLEQLQLATRIATLGKISINTDGEYQITEW